jgi:hypothetical protein
LQILLKYLAGKTVSWTLLPLFISTILKFQYREPECLITGECKQMDLTHTTLTSTWTLLLHLIVALISFIPNQMTITKLGAFILRRIEIFCKRVFQWPSLKGGPPTTLVKALENKAFYAKFNVSQRDSDRRWVERFQITQDKVLATIGRKFWSKMWTPKLELVPWI